nr:hypothetical protein [Candidatus Sigynarchaeota archaeon]
MNQEQDGSIALLNTPFERDGTKIANRLVAQPMERSASTQKGELTSELISEYITLAKGHWGILHVEAMSVTSQYRSRKGQLVLDDATSRDLKDLLVKMWECAPETKYIVQLTVPGVVTGDGLEKSTIISSVHDANPAIKLLSDGDIDGIIDAFKHAIDLAIDAGIDGIDIKACHGYLGAEFLRPANTRPGPYGGSIENRTRFFKELVIHARNAANNAGKKDFLLGSRVSVAEYIIGGIGTAGPCEFIEDLAEVKHIASMLCAWGENFINVTAGIPAQVPEITRPVKNVPWGIWNHFRLTKAIKDHLSSEGQHPAIIGSAYSMLGKDLPHYAGKNIMDEAVDLIGLGRQVLADPAYPEKLFSCSQQINFCKGCGSCAQLLREQQHVGCAFYNPAFKSSLRT